MASISKRNAGGKPRYDVNYRAPDGRARRKSFTRKLEAEAFRVSVETDKLRGSYIDPNAGRIAFRDYADQWLAQQVTAPTTRERIESTLRVRVYPVLGPCPLAQIKPSTIQSWLAGLSGAHSTRRLTLSTVSAIMSAAVDDERILKNPCSAKSVFTPRPPTRKLIPWSTDRVASVLSQLPERYQILVVLGAGLGLRQGEILGLSVNDVDFLRGTVEVRRQIRQVKSRMVFAPPKANKTRIVPLPGSVRDLLAAHLARDPAAGVSLPWLDLDGKPTQVQLVARGHHGGALNRNHVNHYIWKPALRSLGIEATRENGMHALRHHYASVLLDAGESIKAVSEYLGHTDPGFTLRVYTHLLPTSAVRTRQAVDEAFACYMGGTWGAPQASEASPDLDV